MKKHKARFMARSWDFFGWNKNLFGIFTIDITKIAFYVQVIISGKIFPNEQKAHCPFSVCINES